MEVTKEFKTSISNSDLVQVKFMGHNVEIQHMKFRKTDMPIRIYDKNHYYFVNDMYDENGEIILHEFNFTDDRSNSKESLRQSFKNLRDVINTNFTGCPNEKFITLTYAENMTCPKKLYQDFDKFMKKLKYYFKNTCPNIKYINVVEPQARGAWHCHVLVKFMDLDKLFLDYSLISDMWTHGYTDTRGLEKCDNIGSYLTAYLADIEIDCDSIPLGGDVVEKEINHNGKKVKKKFIKGGRLSYYPRDMRIWRCSRNCDKPKKEIKKYGKIKKELGLAEPNYTQKIELIDTEKIINIIQYEQYNLNRKKENNKNLQKV